MRRKHLDFLRKQTQKEMEQRDREDMTNELAILRSSDEGLSQEDIEVLRVLKTNIRAKHWEN